MLLIGGYLFGMVGIAQWLTMSGGDLSRMSAMVFVVAASVGALLVLPSRRLRGWIRVSIAKHFFQHRYDYRAEWLRFTRTIGQAGPGAAALSNSAWCRPWPILPKAPPGCCCRRDDEAGDTGADGALAVAEIAAVPPEALDAAATRFLEQTGFIIDLDDGAGGPRDTRRGRCRTCLADRGRARLGHGAPAAF